MGGGGGRGSLPFLSPPLRQLQDRDYSSFSSFPLDGDSGSCPEFSFFTHPSSPWMKKRKEGVLSSRGERRREEDKSENTLCFENKRTGTPPPPQGWLVFLLMEERGFSNSFSVFFVGPRAEGVFCPFFSRNLDPATPQKRLLGR